MEHIHGGILCLLCKWISLPLSQAKGQKKKIPAQFHHRRLLEYIKASSPIEGGKNTGRLDLFLQKKKKKLIPGKCWPPRDQFFWELFFFFFCVLQRAGSSLFTGVLCCGLCTQKTVQPSERSYCHCHCAV